MQIWLLQHLPSNWPGANVCKPAESWPLPTCWYWAACQTARSACHLQTNGWDERSNQTILCIFLKYVNEEQDDWDKQLEFILFSYCTSAHSSTNFTILCDVCMGGILYSLLSWRYADNDHLYKGKLVGWPGSIKHPSIFSNSRRVNVKQQHCAMTHTEHWLHTQVPNPQLGHWGKRINVVLCQTGPESIKSWCWTTLHSYKTTFP